MHEIDFFKSAVGQLSSAWDGRAISKVAGLSVPALILGRRHSELLKADIHSQWAHWFIEGLTDPLQYLDPRWTYPYIFKDVFSAVEATFAHCTRNEKQDLASAAAAVVERKAELLRTSKQRVRADREQRIVLLGLAGTPARCWICGLQFHESAIQNFLDGTGSNPLPIPPFIDVFKPIGLVQQDLRIEVDHVHSFAHGGGEGDNLRLACGWCNRHKSALVSLYDVEGRPLQAGRNELGITSLPQKFWVVRLLALQRECEHVDGCSCSCETSEMTVVAINSKGALNPSNLRVTCREHDPLKSFRLQPRRVVEILWS